ncbi:amino acid transporter, putative [Entamoeba nuttalli P19]|uniref:Amino acid transporter, putative n=1 Tax=Entamoeba nuttalli (strain P19) TaxID=1076696 RepID=K2GUL5_ENTNP|nr:amino acid transporter, putative [Entamoeba nuttalli P19]EKE37547.1 amino acid transporter, putative [Entamoeba nuttalli P19]|eukprot:XP_008860117.1 amino acid transporter, putative [Entamoeba nuttalli P19]
MNDQPLLQPIENIEKEPLNEGNKKIKTITTFSVFPLIINAAIGTGIFGLPFAYYEAGVYPSLMVLILFFIVNNITSGYVLEALSRLNILPKSFKESPQIIEENKCFIKETYGYTEMGYRLGSYPLKFFANLSLVLNCYAGLWAYVATCIKTFTTIIWIIIGNQDYCHSKNHFLDSWECQLTYYGSLIIYGLVVIPLSFLDVGKQAIVHIILTIVRFGSFTVMIITCIIQVAVDGPLTNERNVFDFYWNGFGTVFTHTAFAFVVQHTIPSIISPVKGEKRKVNLPIISALSIASVFYALIAVICSYTFNGKVLTPVTLNWSTYTGRNGGWGEGKELWFAYIIKYLILFFPVFNLTSSFPILSNTLAMNIENLFPHRYVLNHPKKCKYISRALAIFPPFILTCFIDSLEIIFDFAGIIAFFLAFTLPCLFIFMSLYRFNGFTLFTIKPKTPFTNIITSTPFVVMIIFFVTLILFMISLFFLIQETVLSFINDSSSSGSFSFSN